MKKYILPLLTVFLLLSFSSGWAQTDQDFRQKPPEPGPAPEIQLGDYKTFTLDNGLTVIVVENHELPVVTFQLLLDLPPVTEGEYAGVSEMAGNLLKTGTTTMSKAEIDEAVDFIGATFFTSAQGMYGSTLTKHRKKLLEVMRDVLLNPVFPQEELEKVKLQTLSALEQAKEDPNAIASNVSKVLRYGKDHPYGELVTEETVERIDREQVRQYYQNYFVPGAACLAIVGDISPKEARDAASVYFGDWKKGILPESEFVEAERPERRQVAVVDKTGAVQSVINITYPVNLKPGAEDAIPAQLMNTLLGGGGFFGSRLIQNLRETKGYTYGAYSSLSADQYEGYFNAGASVRNQVTDSAVAQFLHEMQRIASQEVTESELQQVKSVMAGKFARSLEDPETVARFALNIARYDLPEDYYASYLQKIEAVSAEDVKRVARKYITPEKAWIVVVGNRDEIADKLRQFSADGEVGFYSPFGEPVQPATGYTGDMTAEEVINNYLAAIGGRGQLQNVQSISRVMEATTPMGKINMTLKQKAPGMLSQTMEAQGMTVMEMKYDGEQGQITQMGQTQKIEGEDLKGLEEQAMLFPELQYHEMYTAELKGKEEVNGRQAWKITLSNNDKTFTEFYDAETFLKLKQVETSEAQGKTVTVVNEYSDYREVKGIKLPHEMKTSGATPFPLSLEVKEIALNEEIDDSAFQVN